MRYLLGQMVRRAMLVNVFVAAVAIAASAIPILARAEDPGRAVRIVAFGDSLTAGFGLKPGQGFPEQLEKLLKARGIKAAVANAGVSGDTTAAGLTRLAWSVPDGTDAVILELGANDALSGRPPADARRNLEAIVKALDARGVEVLIAGMLAPRNLGPAYVAAFDAIFPELAGKYGVLLYPFFLDGVALDPKLNLADGIHPTAEGVAIITARMLPKVEELIARVRARSPSAQQKPRG